MKNEAAIAAAALKKEIKAAFPGVKFSCRSSVYSGGDSIRVEMVDQPKETFEAINALAAKYQEGKFDGMNDIYEYTNIIPGQAQAKYVFVTNEMSPELKQEVYSQVRNYWQGGMELPEEYTKACNMQLQGHYVSQMVWQQFTGAWATAA